MRIKISAILSFVFLFIIISTAVNAQTEKAIDKSAFYACMASNDINCINAQLKIVEESSVPEKDAFSGTLLMKKASLVKGAGNKLSIFKQGHKKLEAVITKDNPNAELHFLRLMIQEHAPGILGYNDNMQKDSETIKKSFNDLPPVVQHAIADYSKTSKILKPADFNSH